MRSVARCIALASIVLGACGPDTGLSIKLEALTGGTQYDLRVYGTAITCGSVSNLSQTQSLFGTVGPCTGGKNPDQTPCYVDETKGPIGQDLPITGITPGSRAVIGLELDATNKAIGWACGVTQVSAGANSSLTLTFASN